MSKILIVSYLPVYPPYGGGRVRIRQLAANLARRHDVTVVCPPLEEPLPEPIPFTVCDEGIGGVRQLVHPQAYRAILHAAHSLRPDYLLLEYVWLGVHAALAGLAQRVPVALDAFDVATVRLRRAGHPLWPAVSLYERLVLRVVQQVFAASESDRRELVGLGAREGRTHVVPNGVDTTEFRPDTKARRRVRDALGVQNGERLLLFFGQLDYAPNADAVGTLAREIMPRLGAEFRLVVAGSGPLDDLRTAYGNGRIQFLGPVQRIADFINAADAVVAPITHGSGTRLKLLESLACGAPAVATSVAAEGLDLAACGPALTIADHWDAFVPAVRRAAGAKRLPPSPAFIEAYDWAAIVERIPL